MPDGKETQNYRRFLDPDTISRIASLELKARLVVEGFIVGLHRSPYHGFSAEFAEHRPYMPGDAIRHLDWRVYAKTDRYYIKQFEEETNLKAYVLLDASGSMGYTSHRISKLEYGSYLSAALSYLMIRQQDAVGLAVFDDGLRRYLPPRAVRTHLREILKELDGVEASQTTKVSATFHQLAERIKRRGLIIVISDLFDDPKDVLLGLEHFRHKKHEVIVFHVLDPMERDFSFSREAIFVDMETGEELTTHPWQIREGYQREISELTDRYRKECGERAIDYLPMDTTVPFDYALFAYLNKRKRLG